ncbi:hypothetical protein SAMN02745664_10487 [Moraxella cuniculi DSM 21768]|uniref:Uncharacterized protein n=1 Tax=Moraxella cuniculi DSM 21768 TaxID=1122245 RepID=A0A1N7EDR5_9GAMM|nr:hypothetical protein [Moraxella cuniculi]OOS05320.1 hypothetical protein B0189_06835 [Moraxella cuniculi]SIR86227.1 hypothetical protein SAMN02745664_10487 [Moraxella cuniculi DSM 21768]
MKWLLAIAALYFVFVKSVHWYTHQYLGCIAVVTTDGLSHIGSVATQPKKPSISFQILPFYAIEKENLTNSADIRIKKYSFDNNNKVIEIEKSQILSIQYEHDIRK